MTRTRDGSSSDPAADVVRVSIRSLRQPVAGALVVRRARGGVGNGDRRRALRRRRRRERRLLYAGHQATDQRARRARDHHAPREPLEATAGHVAGLGRRRRPGPGGRTARTPGSRSASRRRSGRQPFLYAEITRGGRYPQVHLRIDSEVDVGETRNVAVLEVAGRPGWWRVWVDGQPVTKPVKIRGSSGRWAPIATAESFNGGQVACNSFAFRFERVLVSHGPGGAWSAVRVRRTASSTAATAPGARDDSRRPEHAAAGERLEPARCRTRSSRPRSAQPQRPAATSALHASPRTRASPGTRVRTSGAVRGIRQPAAREIRGRPGATTYVRAQRTARETIDTAIAPHANVHRPELVRARRPRWATSPTRSR